MGLNVSKSYRSLQFPARPEATDRIFMIPGINYYLSTLGSSATNPTTKQENWFTSSSIRFLPQIEKSFRHKSSCIFYCTWNHFSYHFFSDGRNLLLFSFGGCLDVLTYFWTGLARETWGPGVTHKLGAFFQVHIAIFPSVYWTSHLPLLPSPTPPPLSLPQPFLRPPPSTSLQFFFEAPFIVPKTWLFFLLPPRSHPPSNGTSSSRSRLSNINLNWKYNIRWCIPYLVYPPGLFLH